MRAQSRGRRNRMLGDGQGLSYKLLLLLCMQGQSTGKTLLLARGQTLLRGGLSQYSGKVLRLHQTDTGSNIESYWQTVSSLMLHLRRLWTELGRYTVHRGCYESNTLYSVFPQVSSLRFFYFLNCLLNFVKKILSENSQGFIQNSS
jgi:hypothetical protein